MFTTIAFIIGFVVGWIVNDKFEAIVDFAKKFRKGKQMFGSAKLLMIGIVATALMGGVAYTYKLKADNEVLKANAVKLESAIGEQKQLIENQKKDFAEIMETNKQMNLLINNLKKDIEALDKRFNKKDRDIGKLAIEKSKVIERIINKASDKAARCMEIASGSPLTEEEKNATKKSEINTECPSLANPNYIPYQLLVC